MNERIFCFCAILNSALHRLFQLYPLLNFQVAPLEAKTIKDLSFQGSTEMYVGQEATVKTVHGTTD